MRITLLGTGTAIPTRDRFPPGVLVQTSSRNVLVDVGPGVLRRLPDVGLGLEDVTDVLLTHLHPDHCLDVQALLFGLRNPRYRTRAPLTIRGGEGLLGCMAGLRDVWGSWIEAETYDLVVEEIGPGTFEIDSLAVTAVAVEHRPESLAYRFEEADGSAVAISGDSAPCPGLAEVARGVDLFICESSFPDGEVRSLHLSPGLAADAAQAAGARKLCLTHFYPECEGHDLAAQARARFGGQVVIGRDLLKFEVGEPCRPRKPGAPPRVERRKDREDAI